MRIFANAMALSAPSTSRATAGTTSPAPAEPATERTASVLNRVIRRYNVTGNLVVDAQLAALAIEHGLVLMSADTDFARFDELRWQNPLAGAR